MSSSSSPRSLEPPAAPSIANPPSYDDIRPQAGPLPSKRGELGFIEGVHAQREMQETVTIALPARHPADRGTESPTTAVPLTPAAPTSAAAADPSPQPTQEPTSAPSSPPSSPKQNALLKRIPAFQGLRLSTLLAFVGQFLVFAACIVAWVFTTNKIATLKQNGAHIPGGISSTVFVHVVFCFAIIGQMIFLERRIYRLRAERYSYLHPGEMLPRYGDRTRAGGDLSFAYAPWNRPPLPTYAAVLAQSGHGTGDVEDHIIAAPPPPAYGNTRGSTLLLSGFLRESLRAQRPPSIRNEDLERGETEPSPENRDSHYRQTLAQLERLGH